MPTPHDQARVLAAIAALSLPLLAAASPQTFTAESLSPSPAQTVTSVVAAKRAEMLGNLDSAVASGSYNFNSAPLGSLGSAGLSVAFDGSAGSTIGATLSGSGKVVNQADTGRFNTSGAGARYLETSAGGGDNGTFTISFDTPIAAFGFYATDVGDFEGSMKLVLTPFGGGSAIEVPVGNTAGNEASNNGAVLFFGFLDRTTTYTSISFVTSGGSTVDKFGFDDFVVADAGQIIAGTAPEPGSLALAGLALAAAGYTARRRRA